MILWWVFALAAWLFGQSLRLPVGGAWVTPLDVALVIGWLAFGIRGGRLSNAFRMPWGHGLAAVWITMLLSLIPGLVLFPPLTVAAGALYTVRLVLYSLPLFLLLPTGQANHFRTVMCAALGVTAGLALAQFVLFPNLAGLSFHGWDPHWYRLVGTWLDPNYIGLLLAAGTMYVLVPGITEGRWDRRIMLLGSLLFGALLFTFSRSAYLAFAVMALLLLFRFRSKETVLLTILSLTLLIASIVPRLVIDQYRDIDRSMSAQARILSYRRALKIAWLHPFGVGFNLYRQAQMRYHFVPPNQYNHGSTGADSSLLFLLATTGFVGLGAWLFFFGRALSWVERQTSRGSWVLFAVLFGWIVHSQFVNSLVFPPLMFFFWAWFHQLASANQRTNET